MSGGATFGPSHPSTSSYVLPVMTTMIQPTDVTQLYKARRGVVEFVAVPELNYLSVPGEGEPEGHAFADAIQALFSVSYGAHFLVRKRDGARTRVMPLEALWWADDMSSFVTGDRERWQWQAMIVQPEPIDSHTIAEAVAHADAKGVPSLDRLRFERWTEGLCAQVLHVGPYSAEGTTIQALHEAIRTAGYALRGRHHEIYLGDPRRSAPEKLRTIVRQPVALAPGD